jgi:hypothetical protein
MPVVTCAVTHSAPKKVLPLGHKSKGVDELNMRGRVFEISPNARDINVLNSDKHYTSPKQKWNA